MLFKKIVILILIIYFSSGVSSASSNSGELCKNQLSKYFNNSNSNDIEYSLSLTIVKTSGIVLYSKGIVFRNQSILQNNDGMMTLSSKLSWVPPEVDSNQPFPAYSSARLYFGDFYIHKDGYLKIGTGDNKIEFTVSCSDPIYSGFLWGDLYTLQIKLKNNSEINYVNEKRNLTTTTNNTNNTSNNLIEFKSSILNSWEEGNIKYSQISTIIKNNGSSNITSLYFKTNIQLRDENSFWGIIKVTDNNNTTTSSGVSGDLSILNFKIPPYINSIPPGQTFEFGFISKNQTLSNIIFTII